MSCVLQPNKRQPVAHIPRGGHVRPVYAVCHCDKAKQSNVPEQSRREQLKPSAGE